MLFECASDTDAAAVSTGVFHLRSFVVTRPAPPIHRFSRLCHAQLSVFFCHVSRPSWRVCFVALVHSLPVNTPSPFVSARVPRYATPRLRPDRKPPMGRSSSASGARNCRRPIRHRLLPAPQCVDRTFYPMTGGGSKHDQGYISSRIFGKEVLAYYQSVHFFACVTIHTVIYDSWNETHLFVVLVKLAMFFSPRWLSSSRRVLAMCATVFAYTARARLRWKALRAM